MTTFEAFMNGCWIVVSVLLLVFIVILVIYGVWQALEMNEVEKERERERDERQSKNLEFGALNTWEMNHVTRRLLRADKKKSKKKGYTRYSRLMSR